MGLSPEERQRIYEEEKARIEAGGPAAAGAASLKMDPKIAALLCYLGLWVTGIVFIILETKNRYVRFHAVQSIIVFGLLTVAGGLLQPIPYAGGFFGAVIGITTLVLWIVLMVKAYQGERYKVPLGGDMAEKITGGPAGETAAPSDRPSEPAPAAETAPMAEPEQPPAAPVTPPSPPAADAASRRGHLGRMTSSGITIAWSLVWLIVFHYYSQYIAYYRLATGDSNPRWEAYPLLTGEFDLWLPTITTVLVLSIVGHVILMIFDKYVLRETVVIILNVFTIVAVATLLSLFPFDFSRIPDPGVDMVGPILTTIVLLGIILGIGIATLVNFIKLIVNVAARNISY